MKIIFNLPFFSNTVGGITATIQLAKELGAEIRFQSVQRLYPHGLNVPFTVGKADHTFPECDWCITYSDDPFAHKLTELNKVRNVAVYMQSFGMSITNERKNVFNPNIWCFCSTKKIEDAIIKDGGNPINIGFGLEMSEFVDYGEERKNYLAIMYHDMTSKRYDLAVQVADILFDKGIIEGVISFGMLDNYKKHKHPKGLVHHYGNATKSGVAEVFNQCKAYLMPSVSEGLNLTPIESTLCGCPAVICDGAIGELFIDNLNCLVSEKDNIERLCDDLTYIFECPFNIDFKVNMNDRIKEYTWESVANKLKQILI